MGNRRRTQERIDLEADAAATRDRAPQVVLLCATFECSNTTTSGRYCPNCTPF